jgi:hypothetical protein
MLDPLDPLAVEVEYVIDFRRKVDLYIVHFSVEDAFVRRAVFVFIEIPDCLSQPHGRFQGEIVSESIRKIDSGINVSPVTPQGVFTVKVGVFGF